MYGTLKLTVSSPAQSWTEPVALAEAKLFLREDGDTQDTEIGIMIAAAREQAEIMQNRDLVRKQWDLTLDRFPSGPIELRAPLVSVDLFTYKDSDGTTHTLTENTDYIVDTSKEPGVVLPPYGGSWPSFTPWPSSAVLVRFTAGFTATDPFWADAGKRVKIGMRLLVSSWFDKRLPFVADARGPLQEYPFAVTACLSHGALDRVR